ncbi:MAG: hypothetical protein K9M10_04345 [Candidatus Pacebacteria bacterium]|nr:hypothetical protein [Candidatus Paceibacterota bacterium]MCF7857673.1 hypothetical protein [Candidatus Paceibacterota bacterium]
MLKHIYLILGATFVFGFLTGGIIFLENNTGDYGDGSLKTKTSGFEVTAYEYGECERFGCASYQIVDSGKYTYIVRANGEKEVKYEGSLRKEQLTELKKLMKETDFEVISKTSNTKTCSALSDESEYRYDFLNEGTQYRFNSCEHSLRNNLLFEMLTKNFTLFKNTHSL